MKKMAVLMSRYCAAAAAADDDDDDDDDDDGDDEDPLQHRRWYSWTCDSDQEPSKVGTLDSDNFLTRSDVYLPPKKSAGLADFFLDRLAASLGSRVFGLKWWKRSMKTESGRSRFHVYLNPRGFTNGFSALKLTKLSEWSNDYIPAIQMWCQTQKYV